MPEQITDLKKEDEPLSSCKALCASVLLMEVSRIPPYTLDKRLQTAHQVRVEMPGCKIALLCDDNADPDTAESVKNAKKMGLIDTFFYSSVSGEYLASALDAL